MCRKDQIWLIDRIGLGAVIGSVAPLVADVGTMAMMGIASLCGALVVVGIGYAFRLHESRRRRP